MTKMATERKSSRGSEAFQRHFQDVYGDRWPALSAALRQPARRVALLNPFAEDPVKRAVIDAGELQAKGELQWVRMKELVKPIEDSRGLLSHYLLDEGSLAPIQHMHLLSGSRVLDLCAAPGGKSLAMLFRTRGKIHLHLNEMSVARIARLRSVLQSYIPREFYGGLELTKGDGGIFFKRHLPVFDEILVDAPCSGERHLLENKSELEQWSLKRSKILSHRQMGLLCSAFECLKHEGRMVYSTCSISPLENEQLVERFLEKRPAAQGCGTQMIMPDVDHNQGPLFSAIFAKSQC